MVSLFRIWPVYFEAKIGKYMGEIFFDYSLSQDWGSDFSQKVGPKFVFWNNTTVFLFHGSMILVLMNNYPKTKIF